MSLIGIVDYDCGNIKSLANAIKFLGYEFNKAEGVVLKISKGKKFIDEAKEGEEIELITNQTPFYAESGGQVGDQGTIKNSKCFIKIIDQSSEL